MKKSVYNQLPKGVLERLVKHGFHQLLTDDIGQPHLQNQLTSVITIMKLSKNCKDFEKKFNEVYGQKSIQFTDEEIAEPNNNKDLSSLNKKLTKL